MAFADKSLEGISQWLREEGFSEASSEGIVEVFVGMFIIAYLL